MTDHPMPTHTWIFHASVARVVDGDTIDVLVDGGFGNSRTERLRLLNVNAPEVKGATRPAGIAATEYVKGWVDDARWGSKEPREVLIQTEKSDVFGRYLALVWRKSDGRCLNDDLLAAAHAVSDIR